MNLAFFITVVLTCFNSFKNKAIPFVIPPQTKFGKGNIGVIVGGRLLGCWLAVDLSTYIYVSESDVLGPIDYLNDIENLVLFERALFKDYSFKYRMNIFLYIIYILFMSI